jgi:hypothetical protein
MKHQLRLKTATLLLVPALLLFPFKYLGAQDKVAAFKQALADNQKQLRQYQWIETTTISMKGEVKSQIQKQCFYGPDGKVQKHQISTSPQQQMPGGIKGKVAAKKKAETQDYMERAVFWVQQYVPPESQRIQAAKDAGNISANPMSQGTLVLGIRNYLKMGDTLTLNLNTATMAMQAIKVNTYMDSPDDKVNLDVGFATLSNSVEYPAKIVLDAPAKQIQVVMQNANYQMIAPAAAQAASAQPPQQAQAMAAAPSAQQGPPMSPQQIDPLTAPIALYPDALVGQILEASTNVAQLQSFAGWMSKNATLHGDALQAAASKAGFAPCYVALAPFSSVVQMMVQKLDWTTKLGQAFTTNRAAVFDSIQRLRADAAKAGTLKTNQQQTVTTQTTSSGDTVIVVQPTNPQVVYVPTYNPQTVYVQDNSNDAAAAAMVGFTAGVIITAAASNNYYYGPYAWRGGYAYNEAWDNRYQYAEQRQDTYQNNSQYRQDQYSQNSQQRQTTQQANQDYRQTTQQTNQSERQTQQQTNQDTRQSTQQANQSERQSTQQGNQSERQNSQSSRQSTAQTNQSTRQSNAQTGASTAQGNAQTNQASRQSSASSAQGNAQANQSSRQSSASSAQSSRASTSSFGSGQSSGQRSGMSSGGFSGGGYQSGSTTRSQSSRGSSSLSSSRSGGSRSSGSRSGGGGRR